ncbi:MAG: hypothetical protein QOD14_1962 [Solirubrobacterales bacterium]|jgi:hypothetical protein|nr:hypothetical protein [Solirubrobacterales bacterium]
MAGKAQTGSVSRGRTSRIGLALVTSILLLSLIPSFAMAAVKVYDSSASMTYLGEVTKAKCKLRRIGKHRTFFAVGKTTNGAYKLDLGTLEFRGFGQTYNVPYGVQTPSVDLDGISSSAAYSNAFAFPGGQPPGGAGAFAFARRGAQLRLGIYALPNQDYSQGVSLAGGLKCGYPRR